MHTDTRYWRPILLAYVWLVEVEDRHRFLPDLERQVRADADHQLHL